MSAALVRPLQRNGANLRTGGGGARAESPFHRNRCGRRARSGRQLRIQGILALFALKNGAVVAQQSGLANLTTFQNRVRQGSP